MICSGLFRLLETNRLVAGKRDSISNCDLLVLARRLLERVLALGGVYRLGDTGAAAGERLDREEDRCRDACWAPPAEVGYIPLLEAVTSILAVAGRSPEARNDYDTALHAGGAAVAAG